MRRVSLFATPLLLLALGCSRESGNDMGPPVEVKPITGSGLLAKLAQWKGKVVVLDFWAFY